MKINIPLELYNSKVTIHTDTESYKDYELTEDEMGATYKDPYGDCVILIREKTDIGVIVHELAHATFHILGTRWVADEEAHCYMLDYLVRQYFRAVKKSIKY